MIVAEGLGKSYRGQPAVRDVSLTVASGELYALLGPNGAGKSTLVHLLVTLTAPDGGNAWVAGHDLRRDPGGVRRSVGVTFQEFTGEKHLRGRDLLDVHGRLYGLGGAERRGRIAELTSLLDLDDLLERPVGTCSGGMRRRLDLARGLLTRPRVLFLDEPTAGLDPGARAALWEAVRRAREEEGVTVFLTTHLLDEAQTLADRVGILDQGRLTVEGTPSELIASVAEEAVTVTGTGEVGAFLAALERQPWVRSARVEEAGAGEVRMRVHLPGGGGDGPLTAVRVSLTREAGAALRPLIDLAQGAGFAVANVELHRPTLHDVFFRYAGRRWSSGDHVA